MVYEVYSRGDSAIVDYILSKPLTILFSLFSIIVLCLFLANLFLLYQTAFPRVFTLNSSIVNSLKSIYCYHI